MTMHQKVYRVLSIAGSDSSGGAGIQADLKTFLANGVYGMSAVTALTAQNTTGVRAVQEVEPAFLAAQIDAVFEDIRPDAVKVGMVSSAALVPIIAQRLKAHRAVHIVVDPVMAATSGASLMGETAGEVLARELLPLAEVITPNRDELEALAGLPIRSRETMREAAHALQAKRGAAVLAKGGHFGADADDLLVTGPGEAGERWFHGERLANPNTHGTGCTLSSAIAANLAKGYALPDAVMRAKDYLTGAIRANLDLGHGSGPLDHAYALQSRFF